jgi:hypothetical protein
MAMISLLWLCWFLCLVVMISLLGGVVVSILGWLAWSPWEVVIYVWPFRIPAFVIMVPLFGCYGIHAWLLCLPA